MTTYNTSSPEQTADIAAKLAKKIEPGTVITLTGDLGAGKTTFSKGFAKGLGIAAHVNSPTFTLMDMYSFTRENKELTFVHVDTYRMETLTEIREIGIEDYLGADDSICLIEWPEIIMPMLENLKTISIIITSPSDNERIITVDLYPNKI